MARRPGRRRGIAALALLVLGVTLAVGPLVYMFGRFTPVKQFSENMLPTLPVGDVLAMEKDPGEVRRGDVITYDPSAWGLDGPFLGRVVALGGDHIAYAAGDPALTLNGKPLDEPYVRDGDAGAGGVSFAVSVPQGRMFVLGDNRGNSADSRFHPEVHAGTLPVSAVTGVDSGLDQDAPLVAVLGLVSFAGTWLLLAGLGLGIASLVARRRGPVEARGPVWGATRVDAP
ncbi:signal peptidase I [Streptomyces sp. NRRL F-4474]|uniref:signal peptidase I n=1 Tax=Streptomyces sp. NRRL F-4474 TaxID=1463851 RepID=UPI0004C7C88A|nr:signal peptidase I [Streptomyces sp. NRRL F-4474]